ncbi:MAG: BMP family ABC transporter substrate-binding protein [Polyangiaceae bacterium]|nr:BMP family ABC transporter substrate-binding protein [Polyangiaceae bacterium]
MADRRALLAALALAGASLALPRRVGQTPAPARGAPRVGLVFDVGGRGDKSFNDAAYEGLARASRELGVAFELAEPLGAEDREGALRLFAARGFELVIGVGYIFSRDIGEVAADFPGVRFACVDYAPGPRPAPPNLAGLGFREEEASFLVGAAAGLLTRTSKVGFVGGMSIPLIVKFELGFAAGARATCPACAVAVAYAGSTGEAFRDPAKGKAIAAAQIAGGADVLFHAAGLTGNGVFEAARERGARAIGVDRDQADEAPGVVVTSMVKRVDVAVFEIIRDVTLGRFRGGLRAFGLAEGGVDWVHEGPHAAGLSPELVARVEALRAEIAGGRVRVPSTR